MNLTRQQRQALKRVFDRKPIWDSIEIRPGFAELRPITYREFRKTVQQGYDCIMVRWFGMWLGIESDGYTHS